MNNAAVFLMSVDLIVYTYNNKVRFVLNLKEDMKMDSSEFINLYFSRVEEEIKKISKIDLAIRVTLGSK